MKNALSSVQMTVKALNGLCRAGAAHDAGPFLAPAAADPASRPVPADRCGRRVGIRRPRPRLGRCRRGASPGRGRSRGRGGGAARRAVCAPARRSEAGRPAAPRRSPQRRPAARRPRPLMQSEPASGGSGPGGARRRIGRP